MWDRTKWIEKYPFSVGMLHPLQILYGNILKFGNKRAEDNNARRAATITK